MHMHNSIVLLKQLSNGQAMTGRIILILILLNKFFNVKNKEIQ